MICNQGKKNKKFFWVPAIAPLISVILSTFFVFITRADKQDVQIVRIFCFYIYFSSDMILIVIVVIAMIIGILELLG